jgi:hypothetical protein
MGGCGTDPPRSHSPKKMRMWVDIWAEDREEVTFFLWNLLSVLQGGTVPWEGECVCGGGGGVCSACFVPLFWWRGDIAFAESGGGGGSFLLREERADLGQWNSRSLMSSVR